MPLSKTLYPLLSTVSIQEDRNCFDVTGEYVMTNSDPEGRIFLSYPHTNNGFFFLLTTVFIF